MIWFIASLPHGQNVPKGEYTHVISVGDRIPFKNLNNGYSQNGNL
jgi:hypothetical protein